MMATVEKTAPLDEVLDGEYRRCYVTAEPIDRANRDHKLAADAWGMKVGDDTKVTTYRDLIIQLVGYTTEAEPEFTLDGIASVELDNKDYDETLTWNPRTNEWTCESYWESYTASTRTRASGVWDPRKP